MCPVHRFMPADANVIFPFVAVNCGPTSFHIAHHHLCSWLISGREKSGLGSCSTAGSGAGTVECHGSTSWQRSLQAAGYQSQCTAWGEKLCPVFTGVMPLVVVGVLACHQHARYTLLYGRGWNTCCPSHFIAVLTPLHAIMFSIIIIIVKHCLYVSAERLVGQVISQVYSKLLSMLLNGACSVWVILLVAGRRCEAVILTLWHHQQHRDHEGHEWPISGLWLCGVHLHA